MTFEDELKEYGITNLKTLITFSELVNKFYIDKQKVKDEWNKVKEFVPLDIRYWFEKSLGIE